MPPEVILKELQATWLKLTRTGDLQNLTRKNQTQLRFQRSHLTDGVKPEWTFVGKLDRNLESIQWVEVWTDILARVKWRQSLNQEASDY